MGKFKHGLRRRSLKPTKEYTAWGHMIQRCTNPKHHAYKRYGGRGIKVCSRWFKFENFISDMGLAPTPEHSLDRYPDNDGNYKKSNCRWATIVEQNNNKRSRSSITYKGETKSIRQWSNMCVAGRNSFEKRIRRGWEIEKALFTPTLKPYPRWKKSVVLA